MSTPRELIESGKRILEENAVPDPEWDAGMLLASLVGGNPLSLHLDRDTQVADEKAGAYRELISRRKNREPLQYILQCQSFLGREFYVDSRVLIPRQETELLCEKAVDELRLHPASVLDLCCGSGCIGISVKLACPEVDVDLCDISSDALDVARRNARNLSADVNFFQGDLFCAVGSRKYGMILTNPPYIPSEECIGLQAEVLREPMSALDGGSDGLDFCRRIAHDAPEHLKRGGKVIMEIGFGESEAASGIFLSSGFSRVEILKDYQQIPRILCAEI